VLDATAFTDATWLGRGGLIHSDQMHVVEKFTRQGDILLYDVTVEDPEMLVEPWVLPTRNRGTQSESQRRPDPRTRRLHCSGSMVTPHRRFGTSKSRHARFRSIIKEDAELWVSTRRTILAAGAAAAATAAVQQVFCSAIGQRNR